MKRGQSAIEQLGTFGWSLLIVLAVIAAILYFDILDPERFVPHKCVMSGVSCVDFQADTEGITVILENNLGFNTLNMSLSVNGTGCMMNATGPTSLTNGAQSAYTFNCSLTPGSFQGLLILNYSSQPTFQNHYKKGILSTKIVDGSG